MRKKQNDVKASAGADAAKTFTLETGIMEGGPLTAVPAKGYSFELVDEVGKLSDGEWYERKADEIPRQTLDATSGNYLDPDIVSAMTSALTSMAKQRKEHLSTIKHAEEREGDVAADICRALEDKFSRLESAKTRSAKFKRESE